MKKALKVTLFVAVALGLAVATVQATMDVVDDLRIKDGGGMVIGSPYSSPADDMLSFYEQGTIYFKDENTAAVDGRHLPDTGCFGIEMDTLTVGSQHQTRIRTDDTDTWLFLESGVEVSATYVYGAEVLATNGASGIHVDEHNDFVVRLDGSQ